MMLIVLCVVVFVVALSSGYVLSSRRQVNYKQRWLNAVNLLQSDDESATLTPGRNEWVLFYKLERAISTSGPDKGEVLGMREFPYARKGKEVRPLDTRSVSTPERRKQMQDIVDRMNKGEVEA